MRFESLLPSVLIDGFRLKLLRHDAFPPLFAGINVRAVDVHILALGINRLLHLGKHLLQNHLVAILLDDAYPLPLVLTDAYLQVLVCCHVNNSLILRRTDDLDAEGHLLFQKSEFTKPGFFIQHPIRIERQLLVEFAVLQIDVVTDVVGVRATFEDKDVFLGYDDCTHGKTGKDRQQNAKYDVLLHIRKGIRT